ncbi:MAG: hypothetical protein AB2L24_31935 [Mangrovibacterium sp.]
MRQLILIILLVAHYSILSGQPVIDFKKDVKLISRHRGTESNAPRPSPLSKVIKVRSKPFNERLNLKVCLEEYVNGQKVPNPLEMIHWASGDTGDVFVCEVIPDISNMQHLYFFLNVPGIRCYMQKKTEFPKYFECCIYKKSVQENTDRKFPLVLVYEDDITTGKNKKIVESYLVNDSLAVEKNEKLLPQIERYFFVYYQLSKITND